MPEVDGIQLDDNQYQEYLQRLQSSYEQGKNVGWKSDSEAVRKAVTATFAKAQAGQYYAQQSSAQARSEGLASGKITPSTSQEQKLLAQSQANTYDVSTATFTDKSGQKFSMRPEEVPQNVFNPVRMIQTTQDRDFTPATFDFQQRNTYDVSTGTLTNKAGMKMSVSPDRVPRGVRQIQTTETADFRPSQIDSSTGEEVVPQTSERETYNIATRTYTDAKGQKFSMSMENVPVGARVVGREQLQMQEQRLSTPIADELLNTSSIDIFGQAREDLGFSMDNFSTEEKNYGDVYERMGLGFGERIKYAYTSSGATKEDPINVRGIFRVGLELVEIGYEKTLMKIIPKDSILNKPVSTRIPEDIAISTFILGPTTPTTTQLYKELFSLSKVNLIGVTQQGEKGLVRTQAFFNVQRAGRNVKGSVEGISKMISQADKGSLVLTATKGTTFKRLLQFPTGRIITKTDKGFKGADLSAVIPRGNLFASEGFGVIKSGGESISFRGGSIGAGSDKYVAQLGLTLSGKGTSVSTGLLKIKPGTSGNVFDIVGGFGKGGANLNQISRLNLLKQGGLSSAQKSVSSTIKIPAKEPINFIPLPSLTRETPTKTETIQSVKNLPSLPLEYKTKDVAIQLPKMNLKLNLNQIPKPIISSKEKQQQKVKTKMKEKQEQKPLLQTRQISLTKQMQKYLVGLRTPQITQQKQQLKPLFRIPFAPTQRTSKPLVIPKFKKYKSPKGKAPVKLFVKEGGVFQFKGLFPDVYRATALGKYLTGSTIARSYKITGGVAPLPFGYRKSKKKGGENIFVELSKTALSQFGEQKRVQTARRNKKSVVKKRKKKK